MRLSLPGLGKIPADLTIEQAEAIAYRVPMDLAAEDARRTVAPLNYLISLRGRAADGTEFTGLGEAQPRPNQTGDLHEMSWPFLDETLRELIGQRVNLREPLRDIRSKVAAMESAAGEDAERGNLRSRATIMGVEVALLDLAAKAKNLTLTDLLGRCRVSLPTMPPVLRRRDPEDIDAYFRSRKGKRDLPLRLVGGEDLNADLEHLMYVAEARKRIRHKQAVQMLWMNFRGKLDYGSAEQAVRELMAWSVSRKAVQVIVFQNPLMSEDQHRNTELQQLADECNRQHGSLLEIKILPRSAGPDVTQEMHSHEMSSVKMLNLRPGQIGGVLRSMEVAESYAVSVPKGEIVLTQFPGASRVNQIVHRDLARAIPNAGFVAASAEVDKKFRVANRISRLLRTPLLRRGTGLSADYAVLATRARERIVHPIPKPVVLEAEPNTYDDVDYIAPIGSYAVHGHIIEREALARGLNSWRFTKSSIVVSDAEGAHLPFRTTRWPLSGVVASSVARHKEATRILLKRAGCPAPEGRTFHGGDQDLALKYAQRIGYPVVLKPAEGSMGVGVTANIGGDAELKTALEMFAKTAHGNNEFIVEKHINGGDYRIMVIGEEVAAAVQRIPANVVGDGAQTIGQLMTDKNIARRQNSHLGPLKMKWDDAAVHHLQKQGYGIKSVVPRGERVFLLSTNNLTQGGESIEILDDLHPSIKDACVKAVKAIPGMGYCGVDFLLEDHTKPLGEQDAAICELNAMAALPVAEYPVYGTPRRLSEQFIVECVEEFGLRAWSERAEELHLRLTIRGGVSGVGYGSWFARRAEKSGLTGWVRSSTDREVEAAISGPTAAVAALVTLAVLGPPKAAPDSVEAVHIVDPAHPETFRLVDEVRDDAIGVGFEPGQDADEEDFEERQPREEAPMIEAEYVYDPVEPDQQLSAEDLEDKLEETEYDDDAKDA